MSSAFNIPAGFALVPLEPTQEMKRAANSAYQRNVMATAADLYRAMLSAAPTSPVDAVPGEPVADIPGHWPTAWKDVLLERHRQAVKEGWTTKHDDEHSSGAMALAAACYACNAATWAQRRASIPATDYAKFAAPGFRWPWAMKWWKPKSQRQDLVRAGALILAEIERLDRKEMTK